MSPRKRSWRRYDTSHATYFRWRERALAAGMTTEYFQYIVSLYGIKFAQSRVRKWEEHGGDPRAISDDGS